jgi:hypothetical protein
MKNEDQVTTQLNVKVDVVVYKAALRARLEELRREDARITSDNEGSFKKWQEDLSGWLHHVAPSFVGDLTLSRFKLIRSYQSTNGEQVDGDKLLTDAPRLHLRKNDAKCLIERIESLLTQLTMTNQKTVSVSTKAIEGLGLAAEILH